MPQPPKIREKDDTSYNLFKEDNRSIDRVEIKLDRLLDINRSQVEDIKDVKDSVSKLKDDLAELSSQHKMHLFEDATRFSQWELKFSKEIEPILKHVNEKIAFGGWLKANQKMIIFFVLAILTAMGVVKSEQLMGYIGTSNIGAEESKEPPAKREILPEEDKPKTPLHNEIEKAFEAPPK